MLKKIAKHKVVSAAFLLSAAFVLTGWLWVYFALNGITQPLIIHWNERVKINQVGSLRDLAGAGIFGLSVVAVNFLIALELEERDRFLGKLVAAATVFLAILIFIGFSAIIGVN